MMDQGPNQHLAYDDLLRTLADEADLSDEQRAHLTSCHRCRQQAENLQQRYRKLGRMARTMAPEPRRPFRVPVQQQMPRSRWQFKPGVAVGVLGVLIFVFTMWWPNPTDHTDQTSSLMSAYNAEDDARLMAEVDALVNDALPKAYQQMAALSEPILSKDLIDWIVPSIDEDDQGMEPRA